MLEDIVLQHFISYPAACCGVCFIFIEKIPQNGILFYRNLEV